MNPLKKVIKKVTNYDAIMQDYIQQKQILANISSELEKVKAELSETKSLLKSALYNTEEERDYISPEYLAKKRSANKPKILICGYYGAQNGGDELMLHALLSHIDNNKFDITILLSHNYALDSSTYFPYRTIHYPKKTDDCRFLAEEFDIFIWGGGAVIDDHNYHYSGADNNLTYVEMTTSKLAIMLGKKVIVLGVSANKSINNEKFIEDLQFIIDNSTYFSLRDSNSLKSLLDCKINNLSKIKVIDDLALANKYIIKKKATKDKKKAISLGFILILTDDNLDYLSSFVQGIINIFDEDRIIEVNLISFFNQYRHDFDKLTILSNKLQKRDDVIVSVVDTKLTPEGIAESLQMSDYLFSMRYHATLIAGFVLGENVISINYGDTHRHYYNKIKYIKDNYIENLQEINYNSLSSSSTQKKVKRLIQKSNFYTRNEREYNGLIN